jgi:hypothetical protein
MSMKTSRILLIVEAIIIATPISILAFMVSFMLITDIFWSNFRLNIVVHGVLSFISLVAIVSGWLLFVAFISGGTIELRRQPFFMWLMIIPGLMILIGSLIESQLPLSKSPSIWWYFRVDSDMYRLSAPLLIPLVHLVLERFVRKPDL